jgi:tRNA nucleotidyltransferase (CCA-adding enzyme)
MQEKMSSVRKTVLERVTPKKREQDKIETLAKKLERKVVDASKALGIEARVRLEGSVAKSTWLSDEPEIDIFMRVPKTIPRKSLGDVCLKIARKAAEGSEQIERFAEHPYLEAIVEGVRVNIVPCYNVKRGEWLSATDRTPYHTEYVKKCLNKQKQDEVRLLKKFMKGIDVYGAEIKIGGFSGYLCELLILNYQSFMNTLKTFAKHKKRIVTDIENYYEGREYELQLLFKEPLVIVDPVDKGRNVASAVRPQKLYTFVAAARAFLKDPNLNFFYPHETSALTVEKLKSELESRGSKIIFLIFGKVDAVPDVLWGQLYKSQRSLHKLVQLNDFKILRDLAWSDEKTLCMFMFELGQCCLSSIKKHLGPPLEKEQECEKFLRKHLNNRGAVHGPYIEDGRWVVGLRRKHTDACDLLRERLKDGGKSAGVAEQISQAVRKKFEVVVNDEIVEIYEKNSKFAKFLTEFLSGKPKWLEPS